MKKEVLNDLDTLLEIVEGPIFDDIKVASSVRGLVKQIIILIC
ncbi:MAG: hypothetical protein ACOC80_13055 [Petrotogales bacterium]